MKTMAEPKVELKERKWVLAKGKGIKIDGMGKVLVTNANVNEPTIITIISNIEKRTGRKYFGTVFIQK